MLFFFLLDHQIKNWQKPLCQRFQRFWEKQVTEACLCFLTDLFSPFPDECTGHMSMVEKGNFNFFIKTKNRDRKLGDYRL